MSAIAAARRALEGIAARVRSRAVLDLVDVALAALEGENDAPEPVTPATRARTSTERMRDLRAKRKSVTSHVTGSDVTRDAGCDANPLALSSLSISSDPSQASEIPTGSSMSTGAGATPEVTPDSHESRTQPVAKRARGSRVPVTGATPEEVQRWCMQHDFAPVGHPEFPRFLDHWRAQPGQRGVKLDWGATWRNWIRRAPDFTPRGPPSGPVLPYHAPAAPQRRTDGMRCELHGGEACGCAAKGDTWRLKPVVHRDTKPSNEQGPVRIGGAK